MPKEPQGKGLVAGVRWRLVGKEGDAIGQALVARTDDEIEHRITTFSPNGEGETGGAAAGREAVEERRHRLFACELEMRRHVRTPAAAHGE